MRLTNLTALCVLIVLYAGCHRPASISAAPARLSVEELLANPQAHAHTIVKVRGCVLVGDEIGVLQPRDSRDKGQRIWLDYASDEQEQTIFSRLHPELRVAPGKELIFQFDEARDRRAWKKFDASLDKDGIASDVLLLGQFETIAPRLLDPRNGFGHLNAYRHELILIDLPEREAPPEEHQLTRDEIENFRKRNECEERFYSKRISEVDGMSIGAACKQNPDRKP